MNFAVRRKLGLPHNANVFFFIFKCWRETYFSMAFSKYFIFLLFSRINNLNPRMFLLYRQFRLL